MKVPSNYADVAMVLYGCGIGELELRRMTGEMSLSCRMGFDSLGYLELLSQIEKTRGDDLLGKEEEFEQVKTVEDLANFLSELPAVA